MSIRLMRALWTPGSALERSDLPLAGCQVANMIQKIEIDVDVDRDIEKKQLMYKKVRREVDKLRFMHNWFV